MNMLKKSGIILGLTAFGIVAGSSIIVVGRSIEHRVEHRLSRIEHKLDAVKMLSEARVLPPTKISENIHKTHKNSNKNHGVKNAKVAFNDFINKHSR